MKKSNYKKNNNSNNSNYNKNNYNKNNYNNNSNYKRNKYNDSNLKKTKIKIDNLPLDITVGELNFLLSEWGSIGRINLKFYECAIAYVDFYNNEEALYFSKAVDRTGFDKQLLGITILD